MKDLAIEHDNIVNKDRKENIDIKYLTESILSTKNDWNALLQDNFDPIPLSLEMLHDENLTNNKETFEKLKSRMEQSMDMIVSNYNKGLRNSFYIFNDVSDDISECKRLLNNLIHSFSETIFKHNIPGINMDNMLGRSIKYDLSIDTLGKIEDLYNIYERMDIFLSERRFGDSISSYNEAARILESGIIPLIYPIENLGVDFKNKKDEIYGYLFSDLNRFIYLKSKCCKRTSHFENILLDQDNSKHDVSKDLYEELFEILTNFINLGRLTEALNSLEKKLRSDVSFMVERLIEEIKSGFTSPQQSLNISSTMKSACFYESNPVDTIHIDDIVVEEDLSSIFKESVFLLMTSFVSIIDCYKNINTLVLSTQKQNLNSKNAEKNSPPYSECIKFSLKDIWIVLQQELILFITNHLGVSAQEIVTKKNHRRNPINNMMNVKDDPFELFDPDTLINIDEISLEINEMRAKYLPKDTSLVDSIEYDDENEKLSIMASQDVYFLNVWPDRSVHNKKDHSLVFMVTKFIPTLNYNGNYHVGNSNIVRLEKDTLKNIIEFVFQQKRFSLIIFVYKDVLRWNRKISELYLSQSENASEEENYKLVERFLKKFLYDVYIVNFEDEIHCLIDHIFDINNEFPSTYPCFTNTMQFDKIVLLLRKIIFIYSLIPAIQIERIFNSVFSRSLRWFDEAYHYLTCYKKTMSYASSNLSSCNELVRLYEQYNMILFPKDKRRVSEDLLNKTTEKEVYLILKFFDGRCIHMSEMISENKSIEKFLWLFRWLDSFIKAVSPHNKTKNKTNHDKYEDSMIYEDSESCSNSLFFRDDETFLLLSAEFSSSYFETLQKLKLLSEQILYNLRIEVIIHSMYYIENCIRDGCYDINISPNEEPDNIVLLFHHDIMNLSSIMKRYFEDNFHYRFVFMNMKKVLLTLLVNQTNLFFVGRNTNNTTDPYKIIRHPFGLERLFINIDTMNSVLNHLFNIHHSSVDHFILIKRFLWLLVVPEKHAFFDILSREFYIQKPLSREAVKEVGIDAKCAYSVAFCEDEEPSKPQEIHVKLWRRLLETRKLFYGYFDDKDIAMAKIALNL